VQILVFNDLLTAEQPDAPSFSSRSNVMPPKDPPYKAEKNTGGKTVLARMSNSSPHKTAVARAEAVSSLMRAWPGARRPRWKIYTRSGR
jgi:hypothetical protein